MQGAEGRNALTGCRMSEREGHACQINETRGARCSEQRRIQSVPVSTFVPGAWFFPVAPEEHFHLT